MIRVHVMFPGSEMAFVVHMRQVPARGDLLSMASAMRRVGTFGELASRKWRVREVEWRVGLDAIGNATCEMAILTVEPA